MMSCNNVQVKLTACKSTTDKINQTGTQCKGETSATKSQYNVYNLFLAKLILLLIFWDDVTYLTVELEKTTFRFNCS